MPFRYKRYNRRYRRRRTALSTRNITMRTSARNQSKQILSLRNRISNVERTCRPEIQLFNTSDDAIFSNSTFAATYDVWTLTVSGDNIAGQWLRSKNLSLRAIVEYSDNYQNVIAADHQRTCTFRFILFARTSSGTNGIPVTNIVDLASSGTDYELNAIRPLKKGVTSYAKIYYDKSYVISDKSPIKKIAINLKRIMNLHKETTDTHPRGEIYLAIIASGLHFDSSYVQQMKVSFISTYAYSDVN